jgi:hypothetical protein
MKKLKLSLAAMALLLFTQAKSQTDAKSVLSVMNQELVTMQTSISQIDESIKKDKHKELDGQIHDFNNALTRFETQSEALPNEYSFSTQISAVKLSSSAFETIAHKSKLFDKDKELANQLSQIKSNTDNLQSNFTSVKSEIETNMEQAHIGQHEEIKNINTSSSPSASSPTRDAALVNIQNAKNEIDAQLEKIVAALKASKYADVAEHAGNVSKICDKIIPYLNDMTEKEKTAFSATVSSAKKEANDLQANARKGEANHDDIHHHFEKTKSQVNALSAQFDLLK